MMHSLPWQVKRLVVVQSVQVLSGSPNFVIIVIHQYLWVTRHFVHLKRETRSFFISVTVTVGTLQKMAAPRDPGSVQGLYP